MTRPTRAVSMIIGALVIATLLGPTAAIADGACDSGAFCVYTSENLDPTYYHFESQFTVDNWNTPWPQVTNNDNSVYSKGTSGMDVATYNWALHTGGMMYCVRPSSFARLSSSDDNNGQSHEWDWSLSGCY